MLRKFISLIILTLFICSNMGFAFANNVGEKTVLNKVIAVETFFYGTEMTGALVDRVRSLQKDIFGKESKDPLLMQADTLYSSTFDNFIDQPSFLIKLNAIEWSLTHAVTVQPAKNRIENLEHILSGKNTTGSLNERLSKLLKLAYTNGEVAINNVTLNKDSLLRIKLVTPLSTSTNRQGDSVLFEAADDIYVDGHLVIPKGSQGQGLVNKVKGAKNFGRNAELEVSFDTIETIDGTRINTLLGDKSKAENKSLVTAAGASLAGMVILGPVGIVGGAFVHGKEVNIPAGVEMYIQIKEDTNAYGIQ
ncbi:MAG: hypothetical protein H6Q69_2018 [Firmicutes bacterium]|nr:hypothetical protein [Bacillota bacterium]